MFNKKRSIAMILTLVLLGSVIVGCSNKTEEPVVEEPNVVENVDSEDITTDVLVVGGGLAGLSAAVTAKDNGADVILVEKMPITGGSSQLSGGGVLAAESHLQKELGMTQTKEELKEFWMEFQNKSDGPSDLPKKEFVDMAVDNAPDVIQFLEDNGVEFTEPRSFYPEVNDRLHHPSNDSGTGLTDPLRDSAEEKGVEIMLQTEATELIQDESGKVIGVKVVDNKENKEFNIMANSVILASGGFSQNKEMMTDVSKTAGEHISVAGPGTTGDGYAMAESVGADFYDEDWIIGLRSQTEPANSPLNGLAWTTGLYTNLDGERFTNENDAYSALYNDTTKQDIVEYFIILDKNMEEAVEADKDNENLFVGENPKELAEKAGMDPEKFEKTIDRYNELAEKGQDDDFGKQSEDMVKIEDGKIYALKVTATHMGTMGGVKTNLDMEVLDKDGNPIDGLYAAGEMANRPYYRRVYVTGSSLMTSSNAGMIAGKNAAK